MPIYEYRCKACGNVMEEFLTISQMTQTIPCDKCGKEAGKTFSNAVNSQMVDRPRKSVAMGVHPSQIPEAMRRFPGSRYDKNGHLLIANRAEKKLRMKQRGYCEY